MKKSKFTDEQIVVDLHQHKAGDLPRMSVQIES